MAAIQSSEALRRPSPLRKLFIVVAAAALGLGYFGFWRLLRGSEEFGNSPLDLTYYTFQLFVLGPDPLQQWTASIPVSLQIARFAAPAATVSAIAETVRIVFAVELSRWRARRAEGHAIVCGDSPVADTLTRYLRADGRSVIEVRSDIDESVQAGESMRVLGDARDPEVLRQAGAEHARVIYACAEVGAENTAVALAAAEVRAGKSGALTVHALIHDADFCASLQALHLGQEKTVGVRIDFFNVDNIAARRLLVEEPWHLAPEQLPHLLVAGINGFARAVIVEAARTWRGQDPDGEQRIVISVVGKGAQAAIDTVTSRYAFVGQAAELVAIESDLVSVLEDNRLGSSPDWAVMCDENEDHALKAGVTADRIWRRGRRAIIVRMDGTAALLAERERAGGRRLFLGDGGSVHVFGAVHAACRPEFIGEDLLDRLARVIHDRYRFIRQRHGVFEDDGSTVVWEKLSPHLRRMNRSQAEDIGHKLALVKRSVAPRVGSTVEDGLLATEIDVLARAEHERWLNELLSAGWRYGTTKSTTQRVHPGLQPWATLDDEFRRRTLDAMLELPEILADAGFRIVRA